MLASDLVKELQRIIKDYGDCPVVTNPTEVVNEISFVIVTENAEGERLVELE